MSWPNDLSLKWRELAVQQRDLGASPQARTLEWCADRLEEQADEWESRPLTLEEAAEESGYSYSSIQQMVADGRLPNAVEPQEGSLWHAYRRKWATERKHHPDVDVAAAGGWSSTESLKRSYQQTDDETMLRVVLEAGELREAK